MHGFAGIISRRGKMKPSTVLGVLSLMLARAAAGDCFMSASDNADKCEIQGRHFTPSFEDCCQDAASSGYTSLKGWVAFQGFFGRSQVECTLCERFLAQSGFRCFSSVAGTDSTGHFCHRTHGNSTWWAENKTDCCTMHNSSGFAREPNWLWSREDGGWYTGCTLCDKRGSVICYTGYQSSGHVCSQPQFRLVRNPSECCSQPTVKAFAYVVHGAETSTCLPCPVNGRWTGWSSWSPCSTSCGNGLQKRSRECENPAPQHGGKRCSGPSTELRECVSSQCSDTSEWGPWTPFTTCSVTCGTGEMERRRDCRDPRRAPCNGANRELMACQGPPCNVQKDQAYLGEAEWGPWSECEVTCGTGLRSRRRECPSDDRGRRCLDDILTERCHKDCTVGESNTNSDQIIAWTVAAVAFTALLVISIVICKRKRYCAIVSEIARRYYQLVPVQFRRPGSPRHKSTPIPVPANKDSECKVNAKKLSFDVAAGVEETDSYGYEIPTKNSLHPSSEPYYNLKSSWASLGPDETHIYEELHPRSTSLASIPAGKTPSPKKLTQSEPAVVS